MGINTNDRLALGLSENFLRAVPSDVLPHKNEYELLILNETGELNINIRKANTVICPSKLTAHTPLACDRIITCGMSANSTVSFSCINGNRALLSLSRRVNEIQPGEVYVNFREDLSVYENLALQAVRLLNIR